MARGYGRLGRRYLVLCRRGVRQTSDLRRSMALSADVLAIARDGISARPIDLTASTDSKVYSTPLFVSSTAIPHVWKKTSANGHGALAVFGWDLDAYSAQIDVPNGAREVVAPGTASEVPSGKRTIDVTRHATRLFVW